MSPRGPCDGPRRLTRRPPKRTTAKILILAPVVVIVIVVVFALFLFVVVPFAPPCSRSQHRQFTITSARRKGGCFVIPTSPLGREWFKEINFPTPFFPFPWAWRGGAARCQRVFFDPRWLQEGFGELKMASNIAQHSLNMAQDSSQHASKRLQHRPNADSSDQGASPSQLKGNQCALPSRLFASDGLLGPQDGSKIPQEGPRRGPGWPQECPKAPQERPKRGPRGSFEGPDGGTLKESTRFLIDGLQDCPRTGSRPPRGPQESPKNASVAILAQATLAQVNFAQQLLWML